MIPRPLLALLPWLLAAALAEAGVHTVTETDTSGAETGRPATRGLFGWDGIDGHSFLALSRAPDRVDPFAGHASLIAGWNPAFAGFSSRISLAYVILSLQPTLPETPHTRLIRPVFGLDEVWLRFPFDAFSWKASIQAGWFRWRSHDDAALAGEYLTRWNTYPATQARPEFQWEALDSLTAVLRGMRFTLDSPARRFRQEALFLLDTLGPRPGLSLLWSLTLAPLPGVEAGFTVEQDRLWEPEESHHSPSSRPAQWYGSRDSLIFSGQYAAVDSVGTTRYEIESRSFAARLTVDPVALYTGKPRPDRGGRFFLEAALLGWENIPFYYQDRSRRLHVNAGVHLPTFGFLDALRLQADLWPEPRGVNSLEEIYERTLPVPVSIPTGRDTARFYTPSRATESHGWRGQLYLSRALLPWLDVQARLMWEKSRRFGRMDFQLRPGPAPVDTGPWTAFEVRLTARL